MEAVYRMPWYYAAGALLLATALVFGGWRDARRRGFNATAGVMWLLALMLTVVQLPTYLADEIRVDHERMQWRTGPWWARTEGTILFDEVRSVRVEKRTQSSGRLRFAQTFWVVESARGSTETFLVFDLWMDHYREIRAHFTSRGIAVTGDS